MENIEGYCNSIWELAKKNGPLGYLLIHDIKRKIRNGKNLFYAGEEDLVHKAEDPKLIYVDPIVSQEIGKECDRLRSFYLTNITNKLDHKSLRRRKDNTIYAQRIISKISDIGRTIPIDDLEHRRELYDNFIAPSFYPEVAKAFALQGIDLWEVYQELKKKEHLPLFPVGWFKVNPSDDPEKDTICTPPAETSYEEFENLFMDTCRDRIPEFLKKLEEWGMIQGGKYILKNRAYLTRLVVYMKEYHILRPAPNLSIARIFFQYLGIVVREEAIGTYPRITERAISKAAEGGLNGLSEKEKKDFALICSIFT